jgi:hypothetical protein
MDETHLGAPRSDVRVRLEQRFTAEGACAIHLLARRMPPGTALDLDFGGVRECQDAALLLLARDVLAGTARYVFRGLTLHQAKLFGYLGVQVEQAQDLDAG